MPGHGVRGALGGILWYVREVLGENDYAHYVEHLRRRHPQATPMSRRRFEREKTDRMEANPRSRCC